jgi:hypothetical protein
MEILAAERQQDWYQKLHKLYFKKTYLWLKKLAKKKIFFFYKKKQFK